MRFWPLAVLLSLASVQGHAEERTAPSLSVRDAIQPSQGRALNFRLVADPRRAGRAADAGMIASTDLAPNARLGVGLLKSPRRHDYRTGMRFSPRRAAVNFQLKF